MYVAICPANTHNVCVPFSTILPFSQYGIWLMVLSSGFVALLNVVVMLLYYLAVVSNYSRCAECRDDQWCPVKTMSSKSPTLRFVRALIDT